MAKIRSGLENINWDSILREPPFRGGRIMVERVELNADQEPVYGLRGAPRYSRPLTVRMRLDLVFEDPYEAQELARYIYEAQDGRVVYPLLQKLAAARARAEAIAGPPPPDASIPEPTDVSRRFGQLFGDDDKEGER